MEDARKILHAGADKVSVNTAAVRRPELIARIVARIRRAGGGAGDRRAAQRTGGWNVFTGAAATTKGSMRSSGRARARTLGAGEILLTSMDTDGVQTGFDCALTQAVREATRVPVIASGGAGKPEDFFEVFQRCRRGAGGVDLSLRDLHGGRS